MVKIERTNQFNNFRWAGKPPDCKVEIVITLHILHLTFYILYEELWLYKYFLHIRHKKIKKGFKYNFVVRQMVGTVPASCQGCIHCIILYTTYYCRTVYSITIVYTVYCYTVNNGGQFLLYLPNLYCNIYVLMFIF